MEPKAIAASSARAIQGERANRTALNQLQMKCLGRLCKSASKRGLRSFERWKADEGLTLMQQVSAVYFF
jgi:hypothetical protein